MNGESGTSKTGAVHNYYTCYTRKRKHACEKKPLKKEWIEYIVAQDAMELLTDDTIQELADMAISQTEQDLRENTRIPELTERMKETESGIANITNAIEKGIASDALMNRLVELEKEKKNLLRLLAEEEKYVCKIERSQIVYWLTEFKGGRIEDERYRRIIIDLMVNSVTVWDEPDGFRITTAYNLTSCQSKTFRIDPSSEKGFGFEGSKSTKNPSLEKRLGFLVLRENSCAARDCADGFPLSLCSYTTTLYRENQENITRKKEMQHEISHSWRSLLRLILFNQVIKIIVNGHIYR